MRQGRTFSISKKYIQLSSNLPINPSHCFRYSPNFPSNPNPSNPCSIDQHLCSKRAVTPHALKHMFVQVTFPLSYAPPPHKEIRNYHEKLDALEFSLFVDLRHRQQSAGCGVPPLCNGDFYFRGSPNGPALRAEVALWIWANHTVAGV